jgi:sortase A
MRRVLRALSVVLIVSGTLLIADAGITLAWQEPLSALIAQFNQDELSDELESLEDQGLTQSDRQALADLRTERLRMRYLARKLDREADNGQAIGRIEFPTLDSDFVVVQGTDSAALQKGPGHYDDTPLPGAPGTVAIAGHRTTYLAPFRDINELGSGDEIVLRMPYGTFIYRFQEQKIVEPTAVYVTKRVGYDRLVLTACHPLYSAAQRIVVFARLISARPRGAALTG